MDIITLLSHAFGINTGAMVGYIGVVIVISNLIGRAIPDTAVGPLGTLRKVAKIVGLYLGNRVAPGVSNNDAAQAVIGFRGLEETINAAKDVKESYDTDAIIGTAADRLSLKSKSKK